MGDNHPKPKGYQELPIQLKETERHVPGSDLYVAPRLRICVKCPEGKDIHPLKMFYKNRANQHYSVSCRECLEKEHGKYVEQTQATAVATLTNAIGKATRESRKAKISFANMLANTLQACGGETNASSAIGRVLNKAMNEGLKDGANIGQVTLAVKAATTLMTSVADSEKQAKPGDVSDMSEEEVAEYVMEMIRVNKTLRARLLSDPHIRRLLLSEAGVETIDVQPSQEEV